MPETMPTLAIIGSYRKAASLALIQEVFDVMEPLGIPIVQPPSPRPLNPGAKYVRFEGDSTSMSDMQIQEKAMETIGKASLIYVACPKGYLGTLSSYELGFFMGAKRPIYFSQKPDHDPIVVHAATRPGRILTPPALGKLIIGRKYRPLSY